MSSISIIKFIYKLYFQGIKIWADSDEISVFVPDKITLSGKDKKFFNNHIDEILKCLKENNISSKEDQITILRTNKEKAVLSFAQERMKFINEYEKNIAAYNIPIIYRLGENIDLSIVEKSIQTIVERHLILRTVIRENDKGGYFQEELNCQKFNPIIIQYNCDDIDSFKEILKKEIDYVFDISEEYVFKISFYNLSNRSEYYMLVVVHHIAFDLWSADILKEELEELYRYNIELKQGLNPVLKLISLNNSYKDFAIWQRAYLSGERLEKRLNFWKKRLSGYENLNLFTDNARSNIIDYRGDQLYFKIDQDLADSLRKLSKELEISLFSIFLTAFSLLLRTFSNQDDFVIGTPIANRDTKELEGIIGLLINTVVLRCTIKKDEKIEDLLKRVANEIIEVQSYQDLQFEKLISELEIEKDSSRHPIFQVLFSFDSSSKVKNKQESKKFFKDCSSDFLLFKYAKFDLTTTVMDKGEYIEGIFNYATSLYKKSTIKNFVNIYKYILGLLVKFVCNRKNALVRDINFSFNSYSRQSLGFNNEVEYNHSIQKTITERFEEEVKKSGDRIALVREGVQISYEELNRRSNKIGKYLREEFGVRREVKVGLCIERSEYIVFGILGVLKAGGCYVSMEVSYPEERIRYIIEDAECKVILSNEKNVEKIRKMVGNKIEVIGIDSEEFRREIEKYEGEDIKVERGREDLAYIIYTSGTTGKPKGVMQIHNNIARLFSITQKKYKFDHKDIWVLFHSYIFDFTVWEIWGSLLYGGKLVIVSQEKIIDTKLFFNLCKTEVVTVLNQTPGAFYNFINESRSREKLSQLRYVIFGGDALNEGKLKEWLNKYGYNKPRLVNMYGITETTVHATYKAIKEEDENNNSIGRRLGDLKIYILSKEGELLPIGAIGEICIGGEGLARGYLNRPGLTAEKFIANPFATEEDIKRGYSRLYKTGDLGRYLSDGNIEYIGRNDEQVKIRGYRIEFGEIESVLQSYEGVRQSVVVAKEREGGDKYIVGYYVSEEELDEEEMENYLGNKLPEYMMPSKLMKIGGIALTINGKIDKKGLPEVDFIDEVNYVEPRNEIEKKMCEIWEEVLGIDRVGIKDDFFKLGGDSILVIRLVALTNKKLKLGINVKDIFISKSIYNLKKTLQYENNNTVIYQKFSLFDKGRMSNFINNIELIEDIYPTGSLQTGMLIESNLNDKGVYHDVFGYKLNLKFSEKKFLSIWNKLVLKHEMLRAAFVLVDDKLLTLIYKKIKIEYFKQEKKNIDIIIKSESKVSFNINNPGLFRIIVNDLSNQFYIIFSFHHAIADGWSVASLINEFIQSYSLEIDIKDNIKLSYGEFIKNEIASINSRQNQQFWKKYLDGFNCTKLEYNGKKSKGDVIIYSELNFGKEISRLINNIVKKLGITPDHVFLFTYLKVLSYFTNNDDITIGLIVNNRLEKEEGDRLFGLFLNTIPFRFKIRDNEKQNQFFRIFNEKIKLHQYKSFPYSKIKSLLKKDVYHFAFNYMHFHVFDNSKNVIEETIDFERTEIPFVLNIARLNEETYGGKITVVNNYVNRSLLEYFSSIYKDSLKLLLRDSNYENLSEALFKIQFENFNKREGKEGKEGKEGSILERFEEEVKKSGDRIALVREGVQISYEELNRRSNKIGKYLREEFGVRREVKVGLCIERSEYIVFGILGVLKAGGCYVSMEVSYPEERIRYIIEDAECKVILSNEKNVEKIRKMVGNKIEVIGIDSEEFRREIEKYEGEDIKVERGREDLAYIIYTSGTTGKPKGVMQIHNNIARLFSITQKKYKFDHKDIWVLFHSYIFDFTVWEIWGSLLYGGKLVIVSQEKIIDTKLFFNLCKTEVVTVLNQTPGAFYNFINESRSREKLSQLRYVIFGGDALNEGKLKEWLNKYGYNKPRLVNMYGITETTVHATYKAIKEEDENNNSIGRRLGDLKIYILSKEGELLPIGAIGEICIGGEGLARGYLNRPGLTAEKFIANPFATEEDIKRGYSRLYKTGDLGRYLSDGNIEYIGRNDEQVKIRGYRIELGEIESVLQSYEGVRQSVVVAKEREGGDKYIVGYYVSEEELDEEEMENYLGNKLPEYMMPSKLMKIGGIALTINGKIDKKGLPEVDFIDEVNYVEPRNEIEKKMCEIWEEVLGIDRVGIKDDFFKLGGDSLLAIKIISKVKDNFETEINFKDVFESSLLSDLSAKISLSYYKKDTLLSISRLDKNQDILLSYAQQRLWFLDKLIGDNTLYHVPIAILLKGSINIIALEKSLNFLVSRHESLRTTIVNKEGIAYQNILSINTPFPLKTILLNANQSINKLIREELEKPFLFSREILCRGLLIKQEKLKHVLIINFHHIIIDDWSLNIFKKELFQCYASFLKNEEPKLPLINVQYADFSVWQHKFLTGEVIKKQLKYWKDNLHALKNLEIPTDKPRPLEQSFKGASYNHKLEDSILKRLKKIAITENVTVFTFLMTTLSTFLSLAFNQKDIIIGTPIANRRKHDFSNIIGLFLNTLPVRISINGNPSFRDLLYKVKNQLYDAYDNQDIPFENIVDHLNINRDLGRHPVFQIMFVYQKKGKEKFNLGNLEVSDYEFSYYDKAKFEITFTIIETANSLEIELNYSTSIYNRDTIKKIVTDYELMLKDLLEDINQRLSDIGIYDREKQINIQKWNGNQQKFKSENILHKLFEKQALINYDRVAVECNGSQLTYGIIYNKSNQLKNIILSKEINKNKLIGICLLKNERILIPLLATLKAGFAYVPIEPEYPDERIQSIIEDSGIGLVITNSNYIKRFSFFTEGIICFEDKESITKFSEANRYPMISEDSISYVIYTSGSTGRPKGVSIKHNSVVNTINSINTEYNFSKSDKVLSLSGIGFDLSIYDYFGVTAVGGTVILPDIANNKDPLYWLNLLKKHNITIWNSVPQLAQLLVSHCEDLGCTSITNMTYLLSGDRIPPQLPEQIKNKFPNSNVISLGGATEGSIWSIWYNTNHLPQNNVNIPYGESMPNQKMYVLDRFGKHCGIGVIGEIYIGGKGVALHYYNMPRKTAEMFIANPFYIKNDDKSSNEGSGSRIYKTGDLGRYLSDGNIEYIGRNDFQVKIRGYRVELGEIEKIISDVIGVKYCIVILWEAELKNKKLIAYLLLDNDVKKFSEERVINEVKYACQKFLPEYMQPNKFTVLEKIPLTVNGKVNRDMLPKAEIEEESEEYQEPIGEIEKILAEIWSSILGVKKIGRLDNFFNLGGDSIISIQMVSRAKKAGIYFDIKQVFHTPTIEGLARNSKAHDVQQSFQKFAATGKVKLLPIQKWFFKNFKNYNHFNQAFWFKSKRKIEMDKMKSIIQQIRATHEAFRLRYEFKSGEWMGYYKIKESDILFEAVDEHLSDYALNSIITERQKSLDVKKGPIDSLIWVEGKGLLWIIHHLIIDVVSWRILLQDVNDLFLDKALEEKTDHYKSWSEYLSKYNDLDSVTKYYNNLGYHNLTYDYNSNYVGVKHQEILFSKEITRLFLVEAHKSYNTQANDLFLLALLLSIGDIQKKYKITIMLEGHGRDGLNSNLDLTRTIGWFTTLFPVELKTKDVNNLSVAIKDIKEILRQIPDQGISYGIANMQGKIKERKVDILFNYLGQLDNVDDETTLFAFGNSPVGETIGDKEIKHGLEINGHIISKQLRFTWNYRSELNSETIKKIAIQFEKRLIQIIEHCINQKDVNYTPSDFNSSNLDQEELDEILDNIYE